MVSSFSDGDGEITVYEQGERFGTMDSDGRVAIWVVLFDGWVQEWEGG